MDGCPLSPQLHELLLLKGAMMVMHVWAVFLWTLLVHQSLMSG